MDQPNRILVISDEITDQLSGRIIEDIIAINTYDSIMKESYVGYEREPIQIYITSGGGSVYAGNAIIGAMELSETPIVTVAMGVVGSMALGIFVAGDHRVSHRFARFMYHSISFGSEGTVMDHKVNCDNALDLQEMYDSLFVNTGLTPEKIAEINATKTDFYFSANEAKELGIVDDIIEKESPVQ